MKINKVKLLEQVLTLLNQKHDVLVKAALEAKEAATNEESKPENEYDTRGLEASYLAGAQAKRASELNEEIFTLKKVDVTKPSSKVEVGTVVKVVVEGEDEKVFFMLPVAAGEKVSQGSFDILVVTPHSPVGQNLIGKKVGEDFDIQVGSHQQVYEIIEVL
jgi:transcription elongation GreA/GreB family factor